MIKEDLNIENKMQEVDSSVILVPQNKLNNIWGHFETVSSIPSDVPTTFESSIKVYVNGGTLRFYIYDITNNAWRYASLT